MVHFVDELPRNEMGKVQKKRLVAVKITGEHDFTAARDAVWDGLHDPQVLAATMPGARRLDPTGPNEYVITVTSAWAR